MADHSIYFQIKKLIELKVREVNITPHLATPTFATDVYMVTGSVPDVRQKPAWVLYGSNQDKSRVYGDVQHAQFSSMGGQKNVVASYELEFHGIFDPLRITNLEHVSKAEYLDLVIVETEKMLESEKAFGPVVESLYISRIDELLFDDDKSIGFTMELSATFRHKFGDPATFK